jgi:hypothetical protein
LAKLPATGYVLCLDRATLGGATQLRLFLFVSLHPRWTRQVRKVLWHCDITDVFGNKLLNRQCKGTVKMKDSQFGLFSDYLQVDYVDYVNNGTAVTACFKNCKQLFEYQHLLLLRESGGQG